MSTTVEELRSRLRDPDQVVRAEDLGSAPSHRPLTVFETLPDGRCRTWIRFEGEAIRPREFATEADAVAEAEGRIFETAPQPGSVRHLDGPTPRTVEELKDAMAEIGADPDGVTRAEVVKDSPKIGGLAIFEQQDDGRMRVIAWDRREHASQLYDDESAAVADHFEKVRSGAGHFVTDLRVEQMRVRVRHYRELMAKAGRG
ncbi:hypothetical protein [Nocardioides mangrovi]|uniref:Uncharacterized protein n=1 Tax=Nocardioides mangrovi TaxID=2874580 RepID=A0ABS7UG44_9ACTN|nr:hypothetical protein [Nocardioides mangrovi]MBZ5739799.1 hypothetical protein [Nocardioides mangrovi]